VGHRIPNELSNRPVPPRSQKQLAVAGSADAQIDSRQAAAHRSLNQLAHRHTNATGREVDRSSRSIRSGHFDELGIGRRRESTPPAGLALEVRVEERAQSIRGDFDLAAGVDP
jgi:hypothetical protein